MRKKQRIWLVLLIIAVLVTRIPFLVNQDVAFDYDHGRDALAVAHLTRLFKLKFIGPWTSIPGLFFGPAYYYLLAPLSVLSNGHPMSQVWTMFGLVLIQVYLAYRYFGFFEALIMAMAPAFVTLSIGSSNAFPMSLVSLLLLILLNKMIDKRKVSNWQVFWLGVIMSLGFHFSSALAIFLIPAVLIIILKNKIKLDLKNVMIGILGFGLVFLPQVLFEIKNDFIEVKGVVEYLKYGERHRLTLNKFKYMIGQIGHELKLASLPELGRWYWGEILVGLGIAWMILKKIKFKLWFELLILLVIPMIGFSGLHYNPWYVYGLFPVAVLAVAQVIKNSPKVIKILFISMMVVSPVLGLVRYRGASQENYLTGRVFYNNKVKVVDYIYQQSQGKPFSVFVYTPEIYDYAWQYLFFNRGFEGSYLPVEFSYKPGEISYVKEKPDLLILFNPKAQKSEATFLVINLPENIHHYPLTEWLNNFEQTDYKKISITEELEVWEVMR